MQNGMNIQEQQEWDYRVNERLGILCGQDDPTPGQVAMAQAEANQALAVLQRKRPDPLGSGLGPVVEV